MPQVLTTAAIIRCPHQALGVSTSLNPLWAVNGFPVLAENDMGVFPTCVAIPPCVGYQLRSMGLNASQISGRKVILVTDFNQTFTGLPLEMSETHQVIDNSLPAALPPGQEAPPLTGAIADIVGTQVQGAPTSASFSTTTTLPAVVIFTFTLFGAFPLQWILTHTADPLGVHEDWTSDPRVTPNGGQWNSPSLTVVLKLTAADMAALGVATHRLFMTAISQRGLNSFVEVDLSVTT
jgi:hypothetical protein